MNSVSIIGTGAVGRSMALALFTSSIPIYSLFSFSGKSATKIGKKVKAKQFGTLNSSSILGDMIIVCVPDSEIKNVASSILHLKLPVRNKVIVHTSGVETSAEFLTLRRRGASIGSCHPMQTFPRSKYSNITGIWFAVEGDRRANNMFKKIAKKLGANTFLIHKEAKVLYHMAGVFASNYLVTLLSVVEILAKKSGIPTGQIWKIFQPIMEQTLRNVVKLSPEKAITGPILRGDLQTVQKHLKALTKMKLKNLETLYSAMGIETVRLVKKRK